MITIIIKGKNFVFRTVDHFLKLAAAFCLLSIFFTGCWDNREPEWLARSMLLAFDLDEENMYEATVVLANPIFQAGGQSGNGGGGGTKLPFWVHSARGRTPFEAVLNLSQATSRMTLLAHTQVLLFSEKLAREGIWPVLELFQRNRELRLTIQTAVVDGDLNELLRAECPLEFLPSTGIDRLLRITGIERSIIPDSQLLKKLIEYTRPGEEMTLPRLKVLSQEKETGQDTQSENQQSPPGPPAEAIGAAVFRGEKMAGWMDGHETRGQNWIINTMHRGPIVVDLPEEEGLVTIEITKMQSKIEPQKRDGGIMITVEIKAEGRLQDLVTPPGNTPRLEQEFIQSLENRFAEIIRRDCKRSLTRAKELEADIFGFGNTVYRKYPRLWEDELARRWKDIFLDLTVEFLVEATLNRPGLVLSSPTHG